MEFDERLQKWFNEWLLIPQDAHMLCPRISNEDDEDYNNPTAHNSGISVEEKKKRIADGDKRIEITYWVSVIFGYDEKLAGKSLTDYATRLTDVLESCSDCVRNWHRLRQHYLQSFLETWGEEASSQIGEILNERDIARIEQKLTWTKQYMEKIESQTGSKFKKSQLGEHQSGVLICIYEVICYAKFFVEPTRRTLFQYVFSRLQGKTGLKLGSSGPLPGMTYFVFDHKNEDRRNWALKNWDFVEDSSIEDSIFDWAVGPGLATAIDYIATKDPQQYDPESFLEMEQFWAGFEKILMKLQDSLLLDRLRNLRGSSNATIYDLLFSHIPYCESEGLLVVAIRVLTRLLKKYPKAIWDFIGDAKPNVIADSIISNQIFTHLLQQSLDPCWDRVDPSDSMPFATSWVLPWMESLVRDRKYDACETLLQTLFHRFGDDKALGEPARAACIRTGLDALTHTVQSFTDNNTAVIVGGTTHLYANMTIDLVTKNQKVILDNINQPRSGEPSEGWTTFKVSASVSKLVRAAMGLDQKLFYEENQTIRAQNPPAGVQFRKSNDFWLMIKEVYDSTKDQVSITQDILSALQPLIGVEQTRAKKSGETLGPCLVTFNAMLKETTETIAMIIGRVEDLEVMELNSVFADRRPIKVIIGLSVHDEKDLADASLQVLKAWTGEDDKMEAFQQLARLHPEQTLASIVSALSQISQGTMPWGPIRPLVTMIRAVLVGLVDPAAGVLRSENLSPKLIAILIRWWSDLWRFVSRCCSQIERWSHYISNNIMTEFCREIMELAEAIIAEDGLFASAVAMKRDEKESMKKLLEPAKENFKGMENMIRLKDLWLVDVTVRVLCKILTRLRQNGLEINEHSKKLIIDASAPTATGRYVRTTNLKDQQRAELLEALGHKLEDVRAAQAEVISIKDATKKQSRLDSWSKSGASSSASSPGSSVNAKEHRSNRDDVLALSKSLDSPLLRQLEAKKAKSLPKVPDQKAISALKESRQRAKLEKAKRDAEAIAKAKQLRGEGADSLTGKDKSEIMVNSSDEESEGESEDGDSGYQLAALSTGGQKSLDEAEKRRLQALRDMTRRPVKKQRVQRSAKEMRARLIPPMDKLHNAILAWDIFHNGNDPPSGPKATEVATKYRDPMSYRDTFFPLLASEAWRAFVTAKDEVTSQSFGMKIASRASVDSYLEVTFTMDIAQHRERGAHEGDILLVSEAERPLEDQRARHCLARVQKIKYKKELVEVMYRVASRNNALVACLSPGSTVHGVKITNMTTIEREYAALESLQFYDLMDEILKAEPSPILRYGDEKVSNYMSNWALNKGQALAVLGAQENDGFTLIQGPPGTGKTKTIVAMVGALLSEQLAQAQGSAVALRPGMPGGTANKPAPGKKLLVCAPSNAAVDELVTRLKQGVVTTSGRLKKINVLRLGRTDAISSAVKDVTLDELVRIRMEGDDTRDKMNANREKLHQDAAKIKEELSIVRPRLEEAKGQGDDTKYKALTRQFDQLKKQQMDIGRKIDAEKESGTSVAREVELKRRQIQQEILNSSQVLCATLSGSGHEMFRNLDVEFETVIIDEAAQCVELSALIPLKYGCCKCILVGDPKQLPPTVLSQSAAKFGYDQSLFVRMQQNHPKSVHLLDMQYRMHPEISKFPSKEFYEGQLHDGQDMAGLRRMPWHRSTLLGPYRFFDVEGVQERGHKGQSLVNTRELDVALQMYDRFSREFSSCDLAGKIGIITPYKAQLFEMRNRFKSRYGESITDIIEFNTTDAFQGRECEIIIFSCVRASSTGGIGFMTDIRRMNVGLTRAKSSLWILGDSRALVQGEFWRKLIEDAQERDRYTRGDIVDMFRKPLVMDKSLPSPPPPPPPKAVEDIAMPDAPAPIPAQIAPEAAIGDTADIVLPRSGGPPMIHVAANTPKPIDAKKRALESPDAGQPIMKRMASDRPRGGLAGKFGQRPAPPMRPKPGPTDPSALATLGLVPPERPAAATPPGGSKLPTEASMGGEKKPMRPPGTKNAPPMPRKKAKPSLFVPKRR